MVMEKTIIPTVVFFKAASLMEYHMVTAGLLCLMGISIKVKSSSEGPTATVLIKLTHHHTRETLKIMSGMEWENRKAKDIIFRESMSMGRENQGCTSIVETCMKEDLWMGFLAVRVN